MSLLPTSIPSEHQPSHASELEYTATDTYPSRSERLSKGRDSLSRTVLLLAVEFGHEVLFKRLLEHGADAANESGDSALNCAARERHDGIVRLLLEKGSGKEAPLRPKAQDLFVAAITGDEEKTRWLLNPGTYLEMKDPDGGTALQWAAWYGHEMIVRQLIESGANIEAGDKNVRRAIHEASECGHTGIIKALLESGAETDAQDLFGLTPFQRAVWKGEMETTLFLIKAGANIHLIDNRDLSALHMAVSNADVTMVKLFLKIGAKVEGFKFSLVRYEPWVTHAQYVSNKLLVTQAIQNLSRGEQYSHDPSTS